MKKNELDQAIKQFMSGKKTGIEVAKRPTNEELNRKYKIVETHTELIVKEVKE